MANVTFLGHASFEAQLGSSIIFVDPWFNKKPRQVDRLIPSAVENVDDIRKADAIFVTSEGFDHCDPYDITRITQRTFCPVIAPEETLGTLADVNARQKVVASVGDDFNLHGLDVRVMPAKYYRSANPVGYLISAGGKSIYFGGATYNFFEMGQINCDVAVIPIGGDSAMDPLSASTAAKTIKAKTVIPMMYNTYNRIKVDPAEFERRAKENGRVNVRVLEVGETLNF